jgi:hypothetical protein
MCARVLKAWISPGKALIREPLEGFDVTVLVARDCQGGPAAFVPVNLSG